MKNFLTKKKLLRVFSFLVIIFAVSGIFIFQRDIVPAPPVTSDFLLGDYYFNHGADADGTYDLQLARYHFEKALKENPMGDSLAWYQLGRIDFLEGKFEDALNKFDRQIEYFENDPPAVFYMIALTYGYRARIYNQLDDWQHAEKNFIRYLEFDPDSPWARTDLAWVYFAQGKYEEMFEPLEVGLNLSPNNAWLLNMYGLALFNTGENAQAKVLFQKAKLAASQLTIEEWGSSYPGNDPKAWAKGLKEFRAAIDKNLELTK